MLEVSTGLLGAVILVAITPRRLAAIVLCAYLVRVGFSYVHAFLFVLPDSQFDAIRFERIAWEWAKDGHCLSNFTTGSLLYSWIGSCVYLVSGRSELLLQLINTFFGTLIVLIAMRVTLLIEPNSTSYRYVGWLSALHPSMVLYSAITMREVAVVFPFLVSVYWMIKWIISKNYSCAIMAIIWMLVSQLFHTGMITGTILMVSIVTYSAITRHWPGWMTVRIRRSDLRSAVAASLVLVCLAMMVLLIVGSGYGLDKLSRLETQSTFDALSGWQEQVTRGRARYLEDWKPSTMTTLVLQLPVRLLYFLGAPFAWDISQIRDLWGLVDGTFLLVLGFLIVQRTRSHAWRQRGRLVIAAIAFVMIVGFASVTSNYGTAFRHRAKFVPILIVLCTYRSTTDRATNRGSLRVQSDAAARSAR